MKAVSMLMLFSLFYASDASACSASTAPEQVVQAQLEAYNALNIGLFANCHSADIKIKNSQEVNRPVFARDSIT